MAGLMLILMEKFIGINKLVLIMAQTPQQFEERVLQQRETLPGFSAPVTPRQNEKKLNEKTKEPLILTSRGGKEQISEASRRLEELQGNFEEIKAKADKLLKPTEKTEKPKEQEKSILSDDEKQAFGIDTPQKTEIDTQIEEAENEFNQSKNEIENLKNQLQQFTITDRDLEQQIQVITNQFNVRIKQMEEINTRREASLRKRGLRTGAVKFTASFGGIISAEERDGVARIAELEAQKQSAIQQAKQAQKENNYSVFLKQVEIAEEMFKLKTDELNELRENQKKKDEEIKKINDNLVLGDFVSEAMKSGTVDVKSLFDLARAGGIKTTPKDIEDTLNSLLPKPTKEEKKKENSYEFSKNDAGKLLSLGFVGEDIQAMQDIFNEYGLFNTVPELENKSLKDVLTDSQFKEVQNILYPPKKEGAKPGQLDYETSILVPRIGKSIYGTRISDKESERVEGFIIKGKELGKTEYEIIDDVLGYKITGNTRLANGLKDVLLASTNEDGLFGYDMLGLARLINSGDDLLAIRKVENAKMLEAMDLVGKDSFVAEADVDYIKGKTQEIEDLLGQGWSDEVGAFSGSFSRWLSTKFGFGQGNEIKAKIGSITADMINKRAGSALTDNEWKRLVKPNVPQMDDSGKAFRQKMDELVGDALSRLNSERKIVALPIIKIEHITNPATRTVLYTGNIQKVNIQGQELEVGSIVENDSGLRGRVEADGTITPL